MKTLLMAAAVAAISVLSPLSAKADGTIYQAEDGNIAVQMGLGNGVPGVVFYYSRLFDFDYDTVCLSGSNGGRSCISFGQMTPKAQAEFIEVCKAYSKTPGTCPSALR